MTSKSSYVNKNKVYMKIRENKYVENLILFYFCMLNFYFSIHVCMFLMQTFCKPIRFKHQHIGYELLK